MFIFNIYWNRFADINDDDDDELNLCSACEHLQMRFGITFWEDMLMSLCKRRRGWMWPSRVDLQIATKLLVNGDGVG